MRISVNETFHTSIRLVWFQEEHCITALKPYFQYSTPSKAWIYDQVFASFFLQFYFDDDQTTGLPVFYGAFALLIYEKR